MRQVFCSTAAQYQFNHYRIGLSTRILDQGNHISPTFVLVHGIWSCQGKKELTQFHVVQCIYPNIRNLLEMPWKQDSHAS